MATIDLSNSIATAIDTQFWVDFLDALSEELELLRTQIEEKRNFLNVREQDDQDRLVELASEFGYTLDRSIDTSTQYIKNCLYTIIDKIRKKSSYIGYNYIFSLAEKFGNVYNMYTENDVLVRGVNITDTITNLNAISDYSSPFMGLDPLLYYRVDAVDGYTLDWETDLYLDEMVVTTLDEDYTRIPTIYLAVEYEPYNLITENSTEYLMNVTFLDYLLVASNLNKKATEYVHAGTQVNMVTSISGYFDDLSNDSYSYPDLKLNCCTATKNYYKETSLVSLDEETISGEYALDLDQEFPVFLDQQSNNLFDDTVNNIFYYLKVGNNPEAQKIGLPSQDYPNINQDLITYFPFNNVSANTFYDKSPNEYTGSLVGSYSYGTSYGIVGKSVEYTGGYGISNSIYIDSNEETISFWIKGSTSDQVNTLITLLHITGVYSDYIKIDYNTTTSNIIVYMTGNSLTYNFNLLNGVKHLVSVTYSISANTYTLYIDGSSVGSQSVFTDPPTSEDFDFYIATDNTTTNNFYGILDELRLYGRVLVSGEINYLYSSNLGDFSVLGNQIGYNTQITIKNDSDSDWYIVCARWDYSDEIQDIIDTGSSTQEIKSDLATLYEEEATITEAGIFNSDDEVIAYATFPPITLKKKHHISFDFFIKRT